MKSWKVNFIKEIVQDRTHSKEKNLKSKKLVTKMTWNKNTILTEIIVLIKQNLINTSSTVQIKITKNKVIIHKNILYINQKAIRIIITNTNMIRVKENNKTGMDIRTIVDEKKTITRKMTKERYIILIEHVLIINHLLTTIVLNMTKKVTKIIIMTTQINMAWK